MKPLTTVEWLAAHLDEVTVVEVAFQRPDKALYFTEGHIPGARYAWWKDLCWHDTDRQFPSPEVMASRLMDLGVSDDSVLVLVGDTIQFATYAFWVLTLTGLDHVATVLDGGRVAWDAAGHPITDAVPSPPDRRTLSPRPSDERSRLGRDDVLAHLEDPDRVLVDMRSGEEFRGERVSPLTAPFDHGAERGGHIPGARHLYYEDLLDTSGCFLEADGINAQFASVGAIPGTDIVTYCRLSHRATLGWFAATHVAHRSDVRVYDGSWTEWGSIVGFPIER